MICIILAMGLGFTPHRRHFFLSFYPVSLSIPYQRASLYIIAIFGVYLKAENNYLNGFLFQTLPTVQYILVPSIFDTPLIHKLNKKHD